MHAFFEPVDDAIRTDIIAPPVQADRWMTKYQMMKRNDRDRISMLTHTGRPALLDLSNVWFIRCVT